MFGCLIIGLSLYFWRLRLLIIFDLDFLWNLLEGFLLLEKCLERNRFKDVLFFLVCKNLFCIAIIFNRISFLDLYIITLYFVNCNFIDLICLFNLAIKFLNWCFPFSKFHFVHLKFHFLFKHYLTPDFIAEAINST